MTGNEATIISGVLSMAGGIIGALGAFYAAKHQMKKTKAIDDENRLVDLKITKLDETVRMFNDLKFLINSTDGYVKDMNMGIKDRKEKLYTYLIEDSEKKRFIEKFTSTRKNIEQIINDININRWYIKNHLDIDVLYETRSSYSDALKRYNSIFGGAESDKKITLETIDTLDSAKRTYDENYKIFIGFIEKIISEMEVEIEKIYKS